MKLMFVILFRYKARTKNVGVKSPSPNRKGEASMSTSRPPRTKRKTSSCLVLEEESSFEVEIHQQEKQEVEQVEQVTYDRTLFTLAKNEVWYNPRLAAKVLLEKNVTPDVEKVYHLKEYFAKLK